MITLIHKKEFINDGMKKVKLNGQLQEIDK